MANEYQEQKKRFSSTREMAESFYGDEFSNANHVFALLPDIEQAL